MLIKFLNQALLLIISRLETMKSMKVYLRILTHASDLITKAW